MANALGKPRRSEAEDTKPGTGWRRFDQMVMLVVNAQTFKLLMEFRFLICACDDYWF